MSIYNISIKGNEFVDDNGSPPKEEYNNYDTLHFLNYDDISPIINIFKKNTIGDTTLYKLNASSGYIANKGHPSYNSFTTYNFNYTLAFPGDYEVFIVNPEFINKGYSFKVNP
jgi:hypothetical protein